MEEHQGAKRRYIYPVQRWIKANKRYELYQFDAFLPQDDPQSERRKEELEEKRETYQYEQKIRKGPKQVRRQINFFHILIALNIHYVFCCVFLFITKHVTYIKINSYCMDIGVLIIRLIFSHRSLIYFYFKKKTHENGIEF